MENKKAQGMSITTIILIILGLVVLVVLILGFTMGWKKIAPWISSNNVETIVTTCDASCATGGIYDFCMTGRTLKADDVKLKEVTCNYLAKNQTTYGVSKCASVPCDNVRLVEAASIGELANHCTEEIITVQALIGDTLESHTCA